jgi:dolichol kinase
MLGILVYTFAESLRYMGFSLPLISSITETVMRRKEQGHFTTAPVTLGLGALLVLLVFPPEIAAASIYVLAFGDSAGTIIGKFAGRIRPAFLAGKSIEGSLACLVVSFICVYFVFKDWKIALIASLAALFVDILPLGDMDHGLMPLAGGSGVSFLNMIL